MLKKISAVFVFVSLLLAPSPVLAEKERCSIIGVSYNPKIVQANAPVNGVPISNLDPIKFDFQILSRNTFSELAGKEVRLEFGILPGISIVNPRVGLIGPWVGFNIPVDLRTGVYTTDSVTVSSDTFSLEVKPGTAKIPVPPFSDFPNAWLFQPGKDGAGHSGALHVKNGNVFSEYCRNVDYTVVWNVSQAPKDTELTTAAGKACFVNGNGGVKTAIGCLPYDPAVLMNALVKFFSMVAGGIALLMMALSSIQMMVQGSDAKALQSAQQRFVGAAIGLVFIIFSVFILKVIGVDILQIPGFS